MLRRTADENPEGLYSKSAGGTLALGVLGAIGSVVWFVVGLSHDRIFFYPPILLLISIGAIGTGVYRMNLQRRMEQRKSSRRAKRG
jgi:hypothetical protein